MLTAALAVPTVAGAQPMPPGPAVEEFDENISAMTFAAGQLVIQARACGGDEKVGHEVRRFVATRARQCAAADPRLKEVVDHVDSAFDSMLRNADATIERRGKQTVCALYRSSDLQVEVATALQMGTQLATDAGRERISQLPCPVKK